MGRARYLNAIYSSAGVFLGNFLGILEIKLEQINNLFHNIRRTIDDSDNIDSGASRVRYHGGRLRASRTFFMERNTHV